jgi:hypothetical protein
LVLRPVDDELSLWKRRVVVVAAKEEDVALAPIVLECCIDSPDLDWTALEAFEKSVHSYGAMEAGASCALDLDAGKVFCPAVGSDAKGGQVLLERDKDGWSVVAKNGTTVTFGHCAWPSDPKSRVRATNGSPVCVLTTTRKSEVFVSSDHPVCTAGNAWVSFTTWRR